MKMTCNVPYTCTLYEWKRVHVHNFMTFIGSSSNHAWEEKVVALRESAFVHTVPIWHM